MVGIILDWHFQFNRANPYKERRSIGPTTVTLNAALQTCRQHWEIVPYQLVEGWLLDLYTPPPSKSGNEVFGIPC